MDRYPQFARDIPDIRKHEEEPSPRADGGFAWTNALSQVGAFVGALVACFAAGRPNKGIAFLGGLAGLAIGACLGFVIDCCS